MTATVFSIEKKSTSEKFLNLFLLSYLLIWGCLSAILLKSVYPDSAENLALGHVFSWSYSKHPPLGMFIINLMRKLTHNNEWAVYLTSTFCLVMSLYLLFKIAKQYMPEREAVIATLLSSLSYYFLVNFVMQYNQNTIMLPFWLGSIYYFLRVLSENKMRDWLILAGIGFLSVMAKYESLMILGLELIYLLFHFNRRYLKGLVISSLLFFILLLPHLLWLSSENFKTLSYATSYVGHISYYKKGLRIIETLLVQPANLLLCLIFALIALRKKEMVKEGPRTYFLTSPLGYFAFAPWLSLVLLSCFVDVRAEWGYSVLTLWVIAFFQIFRIRVIYFNKLVYSIIAIHLIIFVAYNALYFFDKDIHRQNWPSYALADKAQKFWQANHQTPTKLAFVGGEEIPAYYLTAYHPDLPILLRGNALATSGWIDPKQFKQAQVLLVDKGCYTDKAKYQQKGFVISAQSCIVVPAANKYKPSELQYTLSIARPKDFS